MKPPWGTRHAIDLNTGDYRWSIRLGELPELTEKGISPTGTQNYGGPVVTAGGLLLVAATKDEIPRVRQVHRRENPGVRPPCRRLRHARDGGKMSTKSGDAWMAFALPE